MAIPMDHLANVAISLNAGHKDFFTKHYSSSGIMLLETNISLNVKEQMVNLNQFRNNHKRVRGNVYGVLITGS